VTYEVIFAATARRDLRRIPPRIVPAIIEFTFGDLARTPRKVGKPLKGELEGSYGARRGPYRILYAINDTANQVEILRVDHRADVYRNG
jgi:mRNA interferase RelE/StbE